MQFIEMRMKKSGEKEHCRERENTDKYRDKGRNSNTKRKERMSNIVVKIQEVIKESYIFRAFELKSMKLTYI